MRSHTIASLAAVGLAAAGLATVAAPGGAQDPQTTTLTLQQKDDRDHLVDVPPRGGENKPPSAGDTFYASNRLLDPQTKAPRGRTHSVCSVTVPGHNAQGYCAGTFTLTDGSLTLAGPFGMDPNLSIAVTGGTGRYAGARGTARYVDQGSKGATWVLTLLP